MPLDPVVSTLLEAINEMGFDLSAGTPQEIRQTSKAGQALAPEPKPVASVENTTIPGPAGEIGVRIYRPSLEGTRPTIVFFHGGGWVICDLDSHDATCRALANDADAVVMSVDYRLAPEHPFPAAPDDCYAATVWAAANIGALGGVGGQLAVAGDSAGGNLAAAVSLMARDRQGPAIGFQLLIYPVTGTPWDGRPSYTENASGYLLASRDMEWFTLHYTGTREGAEHPYASPLRASDFAALPPAHVITAEFDPLRDEGEAYAAALSAAGVATTMTRYDGMIHGFFGMADMVAQARAAQLDAAARLRAAFA